MGKYDSGINLAERVSAYVKLSGAKSILHTKPPVGKFNACGLKYAPELEGDVMQISKNILRKPTAEKLTAMLKEQGLEGKYVTDNNSLFLEELITRFPLKSGEKMNQKVDDIMICLEDIDHSKIANKKQFLNEFVTEFEKVEKDFDKIFYNNNTTPFSKRAVLQAKYNNPERYQDIMDLLKLYKEGKAPEYVLKVLFPESTFHALPKSDMQKLLRGENYYPQLKSLSDKAISQLETGEAFSVGKEMFVKTQEGLEKLKIDAETYEKLFPPIERYALAQGSLGNCHLMATMDALTKNPNSRIDLYRLFEQVEGGVKCTIKGYPEGGIIYSFNDLAHLYTPTNMSGSLGHKMIEYTYAKNYFDESMKGQFSWRTEEMTKGDIMKIFNYEADGEDVSMHLSKLLDYNSEWFGSKKTPEMIAKINEQQKGISVINCLTSQEKKGLVRGHFYSGSDINNHTIINPWNTMETIHYNPLELADIIYVV